MSEGASYNGRTLAYCPHVYKDMGAEICPMCAQCTHETDWTKQHKLHKEWIASGKAEFGGWWSI